MTLFLQYNADGVVTGWVRGEVAPSNLPAGRRQMACDVPPHDREVDVARGVLVAKRTKPVPEMIEPEDAPLERRG